MSPEDLLQELQEGTLESTGQFTADLVKARDKLARFQLAPGMWILKLVQGAIALGASRVEIHLGATFKLEFPLDKPEQLLELPAGLEDPTRATCAGVRELVVGLLGAAELMQFLRVRVEPGYCLEMSGRGRVLKELAGAGPGRCCLELRRKGLLRRMLGRMAGPERACLAGRCALAPIPVLLEDRPVTRHPHGLPFEEGRRLAPDGDHPGLLAVAYRLTTPTDPRGLSVPYLSSQWLEDGSGPRKLNLRQADLAATFCRWEQVAQPGWTPADRVPARAALMLGRKPLGPALLQPVRYGVCLDPEQVDLGLKGARVTLDVSHLATDLSEFRLAHNQAYEDLLTELREWVVDLSEATHQALQGETYFRKYVLPHFPRRS